MRGLLRSLRLALPLSVVVSQTPLVFAQSSERAGGSGRTAAAQPVERARGRYRLAVEAFEAGRYREAVDYFLEADSLAPSAALSFNIARAYERLGDAASTLRWLRDYLRRAPDAPDRAQVDADVQKYEAELLARGVQQVTIFSTPPGAALVIDGQAVGATPWTTELTTGSHRLELQLSGHETTGQELVVEGGRSMDVSVVLPEAVAGASPAPAAPGPAVSAGPAGATPTPQPRADSSASWMIPAGWIGVGTGGALLGTALVFEVLRRDAESAAEKEKTQVGYAEELDRMEGRQTAARIFGGAGLALGIAGGVLLFLGSGDGEAKTTVGAGCVPGAGCTGAVRGVF